MYSNIIIYIYIHFSLFNSLTLVHTYLYLGILQISVKGYDQMWWHPSRKRNKGRGQAEPPNPSPTPFPLLALPTTVQGHIVPFLGPGEKHSLVRMNHHLHKAVTQADQRYVKERNRSSGGGWYPRSYRTLRAVPMRPSIWRQVQVLSFGSHEKAPGNDANMWDGLERLTLLLDGVEPVQLWFDAFANVHKPTTLVLRSELFSHVARRRALCRLRKNKNLETLHITSYSTFDMGAEDLSLLLAKLPSLTNLTLENVKLVGCQVLSNITSWPPHLETVCILECYTESDNAWEKIMYFPSPANMHVLYGLPATVTRVAFQPTRSGSKWAHQGVTPPYAPIFLPHVQELALRDVDVEWNHELSWSTFLPSVRRIHLNTFASVANGFYVDSGSDGSDHEYDSDDPFLTPVVDLIHRIAVAESPLAPEESKSQGVQPPAAGAVQKEVYFYRQCGFLPRRGWEPPPNETPGAFAIQMRHT
jgi:hypothetical protein